MPKHELHIHIGGSWPLKYLEEVAEPQEFEDLCAMLEKIQSNSIDYHSAFHAFTLINNIVNSDQRVEDGVEALCKDLAADNVTYVELRTGLKDLGSGIEGYLVTVLKGVHRGVEGTNLKANLILSLRRDTSEAIAEKTIDLALKYRDLGVVGIDVSGDSTQGDGRHIFSALVRAKSHNLPITLHLGESKKESAEQQMLELSVLQPERIGHAVHLCEEARQWVREKQVLVELCLTSALNAGMIAKVEDHPALKLLVEGHPVAICTDDPLLFNTTLSKEYAQVASLTGLLPEHIEELQNKVRSYQFDLEQRTSIRESILGARIFL